MAYDHELADRLREALQGEDGVSEKAMFGGLAFLINGNMAVSASGRGGLLLRIDPGKAEVLTAQRHVERFVMRGRAMDGWLRVDDAALRTDKDLRRWVRHGVTYARTLPPK
jgi:TfoX/Sxy family transcriptional regulator of competence genes